MNFDDIFRENYEKILNFCYLNVGDKQLAEDCTQEVFLALSKKMLSEASQISPHGFTGRQKMR